MAALIRQATPDQRAALERAMGAEALFRSLGGWELLQEKNQAAFRLLEVVNGDVEYAMVAEFLGLAAGQVFGEASPDVATLESPLFTAAQQV